MWKIKASARCLRDMRVRELQDRFAQQRQGKLMSMRSSSGRRIALRTGQLL